MPVPAWWIELRARSVYLQNWPINLKQYCCKLTHRKTSWQYVAKEKIWFYVNLVICYYPFKTVKYDLKSIVSNFLEFCLKLYNHSLNQKILALSFLCNGPFDVFSITSFQVSCGQEIETTDIHYAPLSCYWTFVMADT